MLDGFLVANEIFYIVTRTKKSCLMFKIDFEKAFDRVIWDFLRLLMKKMGFGRLWMQWMETSVFSSHMLILVNDGPIVDFEVIKGLCQGDPLSSFLFVLVTEGLAGLIKKAFDINEFSGFQVSERSSIEVL